MFFSRFSRWLDQNFSFTKLVIEIYHWTHWKNYDDCFINEGDIKLFELWKKKQKKKRNIEVSKTFNFGNLKIIHWLSKYTYTFEALILEKKRTCKKIPFLLKINEISCGGCDDDQQTENFRDIHLEAAALKQFSIQIRRWHWIRLLAYNHILFRHERNKMYKDMWFSRDFSWFLMISHDFSWFLMIFVSQIRNMIIWYLNPAEAKIWKSCGYGSSTTLYRT